MSEFCLDKYEVIIFDCDGVLIDINELKCLAFSKAVENYPSHIKDSFVEFCRNSFGISRYEKFEKFFSDFAKVEFNPAEYGNFLTIYSDICKSDYITCNLTEGCLTILGYLQQQNKTLFVASGSDEYELREVFDKRNLKQYFEGVYGSPKTKIESTNFILEKYRDKKILFIGDAYSDLKAAMHFNIDFIYMSQYSIQSVEQDLVCRKHSVRTIGSLRDLLM